MCIFVHFLHIFVQRCRAKWALVARARMRALRFKKPMRRGNSDFDTNTFTIFFWELSMTRKMLLSL